MFGIFRRKKELREIDPGSSPVPWLSDAVWRAWNAHNPLGASLKEPNKPISEAVPTPVTEDDRRRAPRGEIPSGVDLPPVATLDEDLRLLESTPGEGYLSCVHWPVCCERLTTLISGDGGLHLVDIEATLGPLDLALIEADVEHRDASNIDEQLRNGPWGKELEAMRRGGLGGDGINFFQCRSCGRVYGAYSHP